MGGTRCRLQEEASVSQALCEKGQIPGKKPWLCTHSSIWGSTSLSSSKYPGQGMTKLGYWGGLLEIRSMEYDFLIQGGTEKKVCHRRFLWQHPSLLDLGPVGPLPVS